MHTYACGIGVRLRQVLDYALAALAARGTYTTSISNISRSDFIEGQETTLRVACGCRERRVYEITINCLELW